MPGENNFSLANNFKEKRKRNGILILIEYACGSEIHSEIEKKLKNSLYSSSAHRAQIHIKSQNFMYQQIQN